MNWRDKSRTLIEIASAAGNAAAVELADDARLHFGMACSIRCAKYTSARAKHDATLLAAREHRAGIKAYRQAERLLGLAEESERLAA